VAMFAPYWVSFPEIVRLCGAAPASSKTDIRSGWKPTAAALDRPRRPGTRASSSIPVEPERRGHRVRRARAHPGLVRRPGALLIFDETYDHFLYGGRRHVSAAALATVHPGRVVVTGSASKTYAMTGWRLGWALASPELVSAMAAYQSHSTSNASSISQEAGPGGADGCRAVAGVVEEMLAHYARRRELMVAG